MHVIVAFCSLQASSLSVPRHNEITCRLAPDPRGITGRHHTSRSNMETSSDGAIAWNLTFSADPLCPSNHGEVGVSSSIATASVDVEAFLSAAAASGSKSVYESFLEGGRGAEIALADCVARCIADLIVPSSSSKSFRVDGKQQPVTHVLTVEPLHMMLSSFNRSRGGASSRSLMAARKRSSKKYPPYILERTDVWCQGANLYITLRVITETHREAANGRDGTDMADITIDHVVNSVDCVNHGFVKGFLGSLFRHCSEGKVLLHVATAVMQERLRSQLSSLDAVAFVANGSILPRRSGVSSIPMSSPPAIPFIAPDDSTMRKELTVDMGSLKPFLNHPDSSRSDDTLIRVLGLIIPKGITLIVGGGYHGKSTLLRTIAAGVYDKIPGDGRDFCVTSRDAVTVRAEDGRYVNNCNISAFISNLPTVPGVTSAINTAKFSTNEASGSTSQASNVSEAIEMGASAMLVDEDVSAANFMARDGRMRSLVMDESITPLLYRVNGMYSSLGISTVVVVGGVGDWLDVPHNVVKLDKYLVYDATKKAQSVSRQFSHGHVQYAGRGVVHRLQWERSGTPNQRKPNFSGTLLSEQFFQNTRVFLQGGVGSIYLTGTDKSSIEVEIDSDDGDDDYGVIDMSRCEQLLGGSKQLFGCGLCVAFILQYSKEHKDLGLCSLLDALDSELDRNGGMQSLLLSVSPEAKNDLIECLGYAYRPRRHEVAMALARMRGISFNEIPSANDGIEAEATRKSEERKKALANLWATRRRARKEEECQKLV